ncbi:MAG: chromate transporter [Mediterraneibacter faecis]
MLAQMEQEFVDKRKWLTKSELLDMVAVGRSVPGIMITNISMIFGYFVGGVFGGFLCSAWNYNTGDTDPFDSDDVL